MTSGAAAPPAGGGEYPAAATTGLTVPLVIWGKEPPQHNVQCVRLLNDRSTVITGAENGHLVAWKCSADAVSPRLLLVGHSSPITAISSTSHLPTSSRFISASSDGQLCLWDAADGRCIDSLHTQHVHTTIQPYTYKTTHLQTRLICSGDYSDLMVIDPQEMSVLFTMSSRVEPDWISSFCIVRRHGKPEQCVGVSTAGMVKIWPLVELDKKDHANPLYEEESKRLELREVESVSFNPLNDRLLLVVCKNSWQVLDLSDLSIVCTGEAQHAKTGQIIDIDKVAVCHLDHSLSIWQLPLTSLHGAQARAAFGATPSNYLGQAGAFRLAWLEPPRGMERNTLMWIHDVAFTFAPQRDDVTAWQVARASHSGQLLMWNIPKFDADFCRKFTAMSQLPLKYKGTYEESLAGVWEALNSDTQHPLPALDEEKVTASLYVGSQGKLLLGRTDGSIVMRYACEALSKQLLEVPPERIATRTLTGHTAAVRSLFYPHEHHTRFDVQLLVSGGDDFAVILWNINTAAKLFRFTVNGGPVTRFFVPPWNTSLKMQKCIVSVADDHSVALLNVRDNKCALLATRHPAPVVEIKWRPLDDFMLVKLGNGEVYVWQMETASIDRICTGLHAEEVLTACDEQVSLAEGSDEAGASGTVQLIRAIRHKNIAAVKQRVTGSSAAANSMARDNASPAALAAGLAPPLQIQPLSGCASGAHVVQFEVASLILGLSALDADDGLSERSLSSLMVSRGQGGEEESGASLLSKRLTWQFENNLYLDVARLLLSCLHAWYLDDDLDAVCLKKLALHRPRFQVFYGNLSRQGHMVVSLPSRHLSSLQTFSQEQRWQHSHSLTTNHLLAAIATSNTLMRMRNSGKEQRRRSTQQLRRSNSKESFSSEKQQLKQGWSLLAAMHCVLLPEHVRPKQSYAAPRIEMLARRWQDGCVELREAGQALLVRELSRLGAAGRRRLVDSWAPFLPGLLDPQLSIFGPRVPTTPHAPPMMVANNQSGGTPVNNAPPIPPRGAAGGVVLPPLTVPESSSSEEGNTGMQQLRRHQATAIVLLGVVGSEFGDELNKAELSRATAQSLLELLVCPPTILLPVHSPLRRAAIDLLGRGFVQWEPHLEMSRVLLGLLDLAANTEKHLHEGGAQPGALLSPMADACRTARHALSLIASARPPALITALSMEVARYNSAAQHQTIQHSVHSPLLRSRSEVLRIVDELAEKRYVEVVELLLPVGDVLVHCLDTTLLKHNTLAQVFPPITKFYMVAYCAHTRRIAFGGRNGVCVVHELRHAKTQHLQAHDGPVSACAFSEDGKYLATYGAQDAKITFWQTQQSFLGMGQSQMRCSKSMAAPSLTTAVTPGTGGTWRPRLVWINAKSVTLMLPEGKEQRFTV